MKTFSFFTSFLLSLVLTLNVARAESFDSNGYRFYILNDTEVSAGYNIEDTVVFRGQIVLPAQIVNPESDRMYQVVALKDSAFLCCYDITSVMLPASIREVGINIVDHCFNLQEILVEAGNKNFKSINGVLYNADGTKIICCPPGISGEFTVPATVNALAPCAFSTCKNITKLTLPEGLKEIPHHAFYECWGMSKVIFPKSLERIEDYAFDGTIIQFLFFYSDLKYIGSHAFERNSLVECMLKGAKPAKLGEMPFGNDMRFTRLYVPTGSQGKYKASGWSVYPTIYEGDKSRRWRANAH